MNKKVTLSLLSATVFASMAASAFAAPTQGVYMGGSVDKFYKLDDLFNLTAEAKKQFVTNLNTANPDGDFNNLVFVDFDGKGAKFSEILAKGTLSKAKRDLIKTDFEGSYVTVNLDGSNGASYDPRNDAVDVPTGDLKVESVSAINPAEIKVVFGTTVNKTSAETASNYTATLPSGLSLGTPVLQEDEKSVIIPISGGTLAIGASYKVNVKNVLDKNYNKIADFTDTLKLFSDTEAPTVVKAELKSTNKVRVWFNEPVKVANLVIKVDGVTVAAAGTATASTTAGQYYVETPVITDASLLAVGTHTVTLYDVEDKLSGTPNKASVLTTTYTATADTTPPSVVSVEAADADSFYVKFSEPLASFTDANIVVKKGNFTFPGARVAETQDLTKDPSGKTYRVDLTAADTDNPLYATGESSVTLSVKVTGYKDASNYVGADFNANVTLTKDLTGPAIESAVLNKVDASAKTITLQFNEDLNSSINNALITVKKDGVIVPTTGASLSGTDKVVIALASSHVVTPGTYTVELAAGAVKDTAGNANAALTTTAVYEGAKTALTIGADNDGSVGTGKMGVNSGEPNVITINYGEEMEDSAAVLSNYKLDGQDFPAGTTIGFYGDKQTVKITLPEGYFAVDTTARVKIETAVRSKAGKIVAASVNPDVPVEAMINFTDNVKPELKSAKFVVDNMNATATDKIKLTFSENLKSSLSLADAVSDFTVTVNGVEQTISSIVDTTQGDKELVIDLADSINLTQPAVVTTNGVSATNSSVDVRDVRGNTLVAGTTLTVTEKEFSGAADAQAVADAKEALAVSFDGKAGSITLPTTGASGTNISWAEKTDSLNLASLSGSTLTFTQSSADDTDDTVVYTATISKGTVSDTKDITFTVLEGKAPATATVSGKSIAAGASITVTLDEAVDAASKTAIEDAIKAKVTGAAATDLAFSWSGAVLTVTNNNASTAATFTADATVSVTDLKGNTNPALALDIN